jgi:hypothetical protein
MEGNNLTPYAIYVINTCEGPPNKGGITGTHYFISPYLGFVAVFITSKKGCLLAWVFFNTHPINMKNETILSDNLSTTIGLVIMASQWTIAIFMELEIQISYNSLITKH